MKVPYTYTILRYVHDTTTGEFVNVGVALYSKEARYAGSLCRTTYRRLVRLFPGMDGEAFKSLMRHIQSRIDQAGGELEQELNLDGLPDTVMDVVHSILPPDDSSLQWSPLGSGIAENLSTTLESIFQRYVGRYDERGRDERLSDEDVWRKFRRNLESRRLLRYLQPKKFYVADDEVQFEYTWKNGVWHCLEPISFDLSSAESIRDKAHRWLGQVTSVSGVEERFKVYLLLGEPTEASLKGAFEKAVSILGKLPVENEIIRENQSVEFAEKFAQEIEQHEKPE